MLCCPKYVHKRKPTFLCTLLLLILKPYLIDQHKARLSNDKNHTINIKINSLLLLYGLHTYNSNNIYHIRNYVFVIVL